MQEDEGGSDFWDKEHLGDARRRVNPEQRVCRMSLQKKKKKSGTEKKKMNGYNVFFRDAQKDGYVKPKPHTTCGAELALRWQTLREDEKQVYRERARTEYLEAPKN